MKIKTSELTGAALDWAVAICEHNLGWEPEGEDRDHYSTDWAQGGPIIEQIKGFLLKHWLESNREGQCQAEIHNYDGDWIAFGPTPLIAAMRCYVASKLGDTVGVPEKLSV